MHAALVDDDRDARYLLRICAVKAVRSEPVFARESALALHGLPYGLEPKAVYTTGDRRTAGSKAGIVHAQKELDPKDITRVGEFAVCTMAYALADVAVDAGDFTLGDGDVSGRKVTIAEQADIEVDDSGTATHVALVNSGDTTLRYVTTVTSQVVTDGNTVTIGAWKIEIADVS